MNELSTEYLKELFSYNELTGELSRKGSGFVYTTPDKSNGYIRVRLCGKMYYAHRIIMQMVNGYPPEGQVDHIDRDRTNNRLSNLHVVSHADNTLNKSKLSNNTSGVTGVYFDKRTNKWRAAVELKGKVYRLGRFSNIEDAKAARLAKQIELGFSDTHGI